MIKDILSISNAFLPLCVSHSTCKLYTINTCVHIQKITLLTHHGIKGPYNDKTVSNCNLFKFLILFMPTTFVSKANLVSRKVTHPTEA